MLTVETPLADGAKEVSEEKQEQAVMRGREWGEEERAEARVSPGCRAILGWSRLALEAAPLLHVLGSVTRLRLMLGLTWLDRRREEGGPAMAR